MKRVLILAALAMVASGTNSADAFFIKAAKRGPVTATSDSASTLGLRADQLKIGSKRWFEQMEREGRLGGPRN